MPLFRKKPVVIEAVQFTGENFEEIEDFVCGKGARINGILTVATLEGGKRADPGDWIIKGASAGFYPVKPEMFADTYEAVA